MQKEQIVFSCPHIRKRKRLKTLLQPFLSLPILVLLTWMGVYSMLGKNTHDWVIVQSSSLSEDWTFIWTQNNSDRPEPNLEKRPSEGTEPSPLSIHMGLTLFAFWGVLLVSDAIFMMFIPWSLFLPIAVLMLVRKQYPSWMLKSAEQFLKFSLHYKCYTMLLTDHYPTLEHHASVFQLALPPNLPVAKKRHWVITRPLLALPQMIALSAFQLCWILLFPACWAWTIITRRWPRWYHLWGCKILHWGLNIFGYTHLYLNIPYPKLKHTKTE